MPTHDNLVEKLKFEIHNSKFEFGKRICNVILEQNVMILSDIQNFGRDAVSFSLLRYVQLLVLFY